MYFKYHSSIKSGRPFFIVCLVVFILCYIIFFIHFFPYGALLTFSLARLFQEDMKWGRLSTWWKIHRHQLHPTGIYNHLKLSIFMEIISAMHKIKWNVFFLLLFRTGRNFCTETTVDRCHIDFFEYFVNQMNNLVCFLVFWTLQLDIKSNIYWWNLKLLSNWMFEFCIN